MIGQATKSSQLRRPKLLACHSRAASTTVARCIAFHPITFDRHPLTEANPIAQKLCSYCTVLRLPMSRPSRPDLLIIENPCGAGLLGKLQRNGHHPAPAKTRALLFFQLRDALVSAAGPQPAP